MDAHGNINVTINFWYAPNVPEHSGLENSILILKTVNALSSSLRFGGQVTLRSSSKPTVWKNVMTIMNGAMIVLMCSTSSSR
jgi:hypothetical protein